MDHQLNILTLPKEVLENILSYLSPRDKLASSLVCKQWLEILNSPLLLHDIFIVFKNQLDSTQSLSFSRRFSNLIFNNLILNREHFIFLKNYSENIKSLTFYQCDISSDITDRDRETLGYCNNVRILKFQFCFFHFFHTLPKLIALSIKVNHGLGLTDHTFNVFHHTMPVLESLQICSPMASNRMVINRFYHTLSKWHENPSSLIFTFTAVSDFIQKRAKTLSSLYFHDPFLKGETVLQTLQIENLKLKRLSLEECNECVRVLPKLCQYQSSLTELELIHMHLVTDDVIISICNSLPFLECLVIKLNNKFNHSITNVFQLKNLRTLELAQCSGIELESFENALSCFKLSKLDKLILNQISINEEILKCILMQTKYLQYLDIVFCCKLSQEIIDYISQRHICFKYNIPHN